MRLEKKTMRHQYCTFITFKGTNKHVEADCFHRKKRKIKVFDHLWSTIIALDIFYLKRKIGNNR